jgi:hypothetical protein
MEISSFDMLPLKANYGNWVGRLIQIGLVQDFLVLSVRHQQGYNCQDRLF